MARRTRAQNLARFILIATVMFLPTLSLLPLGGLYLWEKGYLLWWALAALATVFAVSVLQWWMLGERRPVEKIAASPAVAPADAAWGALELSAWEDVQALAARASLENFADPQEFLQLGQRTIEAVARRIHPEKSDALWQFTMPEALMLAEQVSRRLAGYVETHIPFGDRMTLAQYWSVYRWRRGLEIAEKAYDVWRLIRVVNPATALTHEARERLSKAAYQWGRDHVSRRLAAAFVEEVGRAAIDLYGGRLTIEVIPDAAEAETAADVVAPARPQRRSQASRPSAPRQAASAVWSLGRALLRRVAKKNADAQK